MCYVVNEGYTASSLYVSTDLCIYAHVHVKSWFSFFHRNESGPEDDGQTRSAAAIDSSGFTLHLHSIVHGGDAL